MTTTPGPGSGESGSVAAIRSAVHELETLDPITAGFLNALAFVLFRVADADQRITSEERERMEEILTESALLDPGQAVLVVEIARHRAQLADCGSAYGESRRLRDRLSPDHRHRVLDSLQAVADADGRTCSIERAEIFQIAHELGFTSCELGQYWPNFEHDA